MELRSDTCRNRYNTTFPGPFVPQNIQDTKLNLEHRIATIIVKL